MAESEGQERTEQPTGKRLQDAREKGQVPHSRELTTTAMLLATGGILYLLGSWMIEGLLDEMRHGLVISREQAFDPKWMILNFQSSIVSSLQLLAPLFVVGIVAAIGSSVWVSGWSMNLGLVSPNFNKLDPVAGIKKIFGLQSLAELLKATVKFVLLLAVGVTILWAFADDMIGLGKESINSAVAHAGDILVAAFMILSSVMIVVASIDVPFQIWNHKRQLRMTREEVKQENKETDGNPEVKRKIKQTQYSAAMRRMMQQVPKADVVITNPTHFAVAIRYDQSKNRAPIVVAKGADYVAFEIRRLAIESKVPLLSAPPLARAIYNSTELDHEIPEGLYVAVAQVLAYVYQLKAKRKTYRAQPYEIGDLPIPDDLRWEGRDGGT